MTPAERERALKYLAETRENLVRSTRHLSRAQMEFKPAPDRWSVAECLEHIVIAEDWILGKINASTVQQESGSFQSVMSDNDLDDRLKKAAERATRVQAPEFLLPTGRWPHDQLLREFDASRKRTADFVTSTNAALRQRGFPHPILGELDCYQWLLLIGGHGERHRAQAEEVMAHAAFPQAAAAV
ncbi:MAG TPA: DinB family protein [Candidatus Acidoferrales bacterium]|nr:DinB family protein [Candidatus Acidoferrales bacterium]